MRWGPAVPPAIHPIPCPIPMRHGPLLASLVATVLILGGEACSHGSADEPASVASSDTSRSAHSLVQLVLASVEWSKVCDRRATCEKIRVDSLVRRDRGTDSIPAVRGDLLTIKSDDLPRTGVVFALGGDERQEGDDATLAIVVDSPGISTREGVRVEVYIRVPPPYYDEVMIVMEAVWIGTGWSIESTVYSHT